MGAAEAHQSERICWKGATVDTQRGDPFVIKATGGEQTSEQIEICEHNGGQNREDRTHGRLHGQGIYTFANGNSYTGAWCDDKERSKKAHR